MRLYYASGALKVGAVPKDSTGVDFGTKTNPFGVVIPDSANLDAFSRLRVSDPTGLFDSQMQYNTSPLSWYDVTTSGGLVTHLPNESSVRLSIDTTANASVIRQTKQYIRYQPGKSQLILMTFVLGATNTNVTKHLGYGDANNGIFLRQVAAGTVAFVRRTYVGGSASDADAVDQTSWNLDTMDGNGASGIDLDWSLTQILVIDIEWLGVGRVRCGFVVDGKIYYAHEFLNTNVLSTVYMTTANLPLRYQITASGAAGGAVNLIQICSAVSSEGGFSDERGIPMATASNGGIAVTAQQAILSIRPKATFNSIVNRGAIILEGVDVFITGTNAYVYWELIYNVTLGGSPSWASVNASSLVEKDVAGTTITGGIVIAHGYAASTVQVKSGISERVASRLPIVLDPAGANPIVVTLACTQISGTNTCYGGLNWRELY